jgi:hypothetical protein
MRATDPAFTAKMEILTPIIQRTIAKLPADQWAGEVAFLYENLKIAAPAVAADDRGPAKVPNPLRPSGTIGAGGSVHKEPGSVLEAVQMAIAQG